MTNKENNGVLHPGQHPPSNEGVEVLGAHRESFAGPPKRKTYGDINPTVRWAAEALCGVNNSWRPKPPPCLFDFPPPNLRQEARNVWEWYRQHLAGSPIYKPELARQFAMLCTYEAWLDRYDLLDMEPSIQTPNGDVKLNPDLAAYNMMMGRAQMLWKQLAIDPVYLFSKGPALTIEGESASSTKVIVLHPGRGMQEESSDE